MNTVATTPFSIRIDNDIREQLETICDLTDRSKAYITSKAIEEYVARNGWKIQALKQAKQEANKGEFISHEAMTAWVESLGTKNELPDPQVDIFKNPVWNV